jgi:FHA domain
VSETGLIVAEVVFLVLLYAFVWTVVRSSSRQLRMAQPPPVAPPALEPSAFAAPMAAAPVAAPPAPAFEPPTETRQPTQEPLVAAGAVRGPADEDFTEALADEDPLLELHTNLDPRLIVDQSDTLQVGHTIPLDRGITIGRSEAADLSITDQYVSHMHARILRRGAYHFVEDLGSTNGTFLNDRRVERDAQLKVHDALRIGRTTLRYEE